MDSDPDIKINIRTGTSTRAPRISNANLSSDFQYSFIIPYIQPVDFQSIFPPINNITSYQQPMFDTYIIDQILQRSMNDGELHRNPHVELDLEQRHCKSGDVDKECTICQTQFKLGEKLSLLKECNHLFHYKCLKEWGKYNQVCPLCRKPIPVLER
jgi:hypothetical protein